LSWAFERHGARLATGIGIGFVEQPAEALVALEKAIWGHDDFGLAGLHAAAILTGSLVLALALTGERLSAAEAFAASRIDEDYQAEKWGADAEAAARAARHLAELESAEKFIRISRS
jgi:chaperone required for assembly of F1-ATPase